MPSTTASVYVVDDSAALRARIIEMLCAVCRPRIVGEAETPGEAIAGIRATHPDAVVLDLNLREGSGLEVLRAFQSERDAPLFIVLTNDPSERRRRDCLAAGAQHFLDKSNEFLRINDIVRSLASPDFGVGRSLDGTGRPPGGEGRKGMTRAVSMNRNDNER